MAFFPWFFIWICKDLIVWNFSMQSFSVFLILTNWILPCPWRLFSKVCTGCLNNKREILRSHISGLCAWKCSNLFFLSSLGWYIYGHVVSFKFSRPRSCTQRTKVDSWNDPYFFFFDKVWGKNHDKWIFVIFFMNLCDFFIKFCGILINFIKKKREKLKIDCFFLSK